MKLATLASILLQRYNAVEDNLLISAIGVNSLSTS